MRFGIFFFQSLAKMVFSSQSLKLFCRVSFRKQHSQTALTADDGVVSAICDSFRRRQSWDAVSRKFRSVELSHSLVERVLLELTDPTDAKTALSFFHWSAKTHRFNHGVRSYTLAIQVLSRAGLITDARALLESLVNKNSGDSGAVRAVTDSLIDAVGTVSGSHRPVLDLLVQTYAKMRLTDAAFDVCRYVEARGFPVSLASFNSLLHVSQRSDTVALVWEVYEHMIRGRNYPNTATLRIMIDALCKEGLLLRNVDLLDRIIGKRSSQHSPSAIVNSSLIFRMLDKGYVEEEEEKRNRAVVMVVTLLKRLLQQNLVPDSVGYSLIVHTKVRLGSLDSALEMYEEMVVRGFEPNSFVYTSFIGGFCEEGRVEEAMELMREMVGRGLKPYGETFDHLIIGCAGAGRLEECLVVFERMLGAGFVPSCLTFDKMVEKLCENGDVEQANVNLTRLLDKGFLPGDATYSLLINGYATKGEVQEVLKLYYEMEYRSMCPGLSVFTSLIQCLCRRGKVEDAEKYLRIMKGRLLTPDSTIYEILIASHEHKGNSSRALQLSKEMKSLQL